MKVSLSKGFTSWTSSSSNEGGTWHASVTSREECVQKSTIFLCDSDKRMYRSSIFFSQAAPVRNRLSSCCPSASGLERKTITSAFFGRRSGVWQNVTRLSKISRLHHHSEPGGDVIAKGNVKSFLWRKGAKGSDLEKKKREKYKKEIRINHSDPLEVMVASRSW